MGAFLVEPLSFTGFDARTGKPMEITNEDLSMVHDRTYFQRSCCNYTKRYLCRRAIT